MNDETRYWLGFSLISGIGTKRILQLLQAFGVLSAAWGASEAALIQAGVDAATRSRLLQSRDQIKLEVEMARVRQVGASVITLDDAAYPPMLKPLPDAPAVLYVKGDLQPADARAVAMVGTRKATRYGHDVAQELAYKLAQQGVTIISGLAPGIDAAAHQGALNAGGRTLAVLGTGIDVIYPRENHPLAQKIAAHGALISEFPLGMPPDGRNFPRRNRIISGLALGVLVVEAPERSGALITAHAAAEQGRDVFAVPANIYNGAGAGCNRLIQDGAKLVMGVEDILDELNITYSNITTQKQAQAVIPENETEAALLKHLSTEPIHIDELVRLTGLETSLVSGTLLILEVKGLAQTVGHMQYSVVY